MVDAGLVVTTAVHSERPPLALRDASEHALVTVVGSHGMGVISDVVLGSVAMRLASQARSPLVVVRSDSDKERAAEPTAGGAPVIVGCDGSGEFDAAVAFAFEEASMRGVRLVAVHSWDDEPLDGFLRAYPVELDRAVIDEDGRRVLSEQLAGHTDRYPDVRVDQLVKRGKAGASLLRCCQAMKPCLVVVESRGRGGFAGLLLGSTSQTLIAHACCPAAIVRVRHLSA